MTELSRRSLFSGLGALIAAPAIVKVASLMPVRGIVMPVRRGDYLTLAQITREAVKLWCNSNSFITDLDRQYAEDFGFYVAEPYLLMGEDLTQLRIRAQPEWLEQTYPIVRAGF